MVNNYVINNLTDLLNLYENIVAFFYQKIEQNKFSNNDLKTFTINYNLLLPGSEFVFDINENQVNAQIQAYIDKCNELINYITKNSLTQLNLFYEQIQNILNNSITQLNGFAIYLLKAYYNSIYTFKIPFDMSMLHALYLNKINFNTYVKQMELNSQIQDFNNLQHGMQIKLSKE